MWIEKIIIRIIQHFCKHRYRKHWNKESEKYEYRCTRCGKVR